MGAGEFPAGFGLAGADPLNPVSDTIYGRAPARAIFFDLLTRRFVFDGSRARDMHPITQRAIFLIGIELGSVPSSPTVGNRFRKRLSRVPAAKMDAIALDETKVAWKALLDSGDIAILSVATDSKTQRGRVTIAISFVNLRDPKTDRRNPGLNAQALTLVS